MTAKEFFDAHSEGKDEIVLAEVEVEGENLQLVLSKSDDGLYFSGGLASDDDDKQSENSICGKVAGELGFSLCGYDDETITKVKFHSALQDVIFYNKDEEAWECKGAA